MLHTRQELEKPSLGPADQRLEPYGSSPCEGERRTSFLEDSGTDQGCVGCRTAARAQGKAEKARQGLETGRPGVRV